MKRGFLDLRFSGGSETQHVSGYLTLTFSKFFLLESFSHFIFRIKHNPNMSKNTTLYTYFFFFNLLSASDSHVLWLHLQTVLEDDSFLSRLHLKNFFLFSEEFLVTLCHTNVFICAFTNLSIYLSISSALSVSFLVVAACWQCWCNNRWKPEINTFLPSSLFFALHLFLMLRGASHPAFLHSLFPSLPISFIPSRIFLLHTPGLCACVCVCDPAGPAAPVRSVSTVVARLISTWRKKNLLFFGGTQCCVDWLEKTKWNAGVQLGFVGMWRMQRGGRAKRLMVWEGKAVMLGLQKNWKSI